METQNKHGKGGSALLWGIILGALVTTLLTTKRGRLILREVVNVALELLETVVEEKEIKKHQVNEVKVEREVVPSEIIEATEDIESEITATESVQAEPDEEPPASTNGNGHQKKRLFRGVRRK